MASPYSGISSIKQSMYYVYILANKPQGAIYIGVTNDLVRRIYEHKENIIKGFTSKYNIKMLVYYEVHEEIERAILREKKLKRWPRRIKDELIGENNPQWLGLYDEVVKY